jgi:hypothetical protein
MHGIDSWDWEPGKKVVADLSEIASRFAAVHEAAVSLDGERIAMPVKLEDGSFTACVSMWNCCGTCDSRQKTA